jgi:hypothetical protein
MYIPAAIEAGKLLQEAQSAARVTAGRLKRRTKDAGVCNALKLSHFTAVKLSHPGLVLSSGFF